MSRMLMILVGVLVVLVCGAGFSVPVTAREHEQYQSPLYILQLQDFTARSSLSKTDIPLLNYTVQKGDSLTSIARRFGNEVDTLVRLNNIVNPHLIYAGQTIQILTVPGAVHRVKSGETINSIAELYGVDPQSIIAVNREAGGSLLQRGERIIVPGAKNIPETTGFRWPVNGGRLSSGFGWRDGRYHYGIDLAVPVGHPFYAAARGVVVYSGYKGSYGLLVELDHGNGWQTRYAHAGNLYVSSGQQVTDGQLLGRIGLTGNTTGAHLHFEVIKQGLRVDPLSVLP